MNSIKISIYLFTDEHDYHIAYCPSLRLSGYGLTNKEALDCFATSVEACLEFEDQETRLSELGWKRTADTWQEPDAVALLRRDKMFREVFFN